LAFRDEKSRLKITDVRLVQRSGAGRQGGVRAGGAGRGRGTGQSGGRGWGPEAANPLDIYPEYFNNRPSFAANGPGMGGFTVEISTDKGVRGYGSGGPAGGAIVEGHFKRLLVGQDPFNVERLWDIMWRATWSYDRSGVAMHAISGVDLALWDIIGKATGLPVYVLLGGAVREQVPCYATGNDIERYGKIGFKRIKLALQYGPTDGDEGLRKNAELVKRTRDVVGPDGHIMLDCWMGLTEIYTLQLAEILAPYRIFFMEEVLPPHDYAGFARLKAKLNPVQIATGEHEYGRQGFRLLLEHNAADVWQPDINWGGGGMTELRRIGALASVYDIPVVPHGGGARDSIHFTMATVNSPYAEMYSPPDTNEFLDTNLITKGPEGVYTRASDKPGLGIDFTPA
jgi:L-rhamnonate dehydratase